MRLVIAAPLYPPEIGGPATYARILTESLAQHDIEVSLVLFSSVRTYPPILRTLIYFFRVYKALTGADCVLALDPVSTGFPARIAATLRRVPFVVKIVGDYAWEQGRQRFGMKKNLDDFLYEKDLPFRVSMFKWIQTYVAKSAVAVIVPSSYLARVVCRWGVPKDLVRVLYNAVEIVELGTVPEAVRDLPRPLVVSIGRLVPWKNMGGIIDAVHLLREEGREVSLAIAGDGPDRASLEQYAHTRLQRHFVFTGALTHSDAMALIAEADAFVLNSTYEGLSHLLIEARHCGVPVVATCVGGNPEVIEDEHNGLLIPPNDPQALKTALERIFTDTALREKLQTTTKDERFLEDTMVTQTAALLHVLV